MRYDHSKVNGDHFKVDSDHFKMDCDDFEVVSDQCSVVTPGLDYSKFLYHLLLKNSWCPVVTPKPWPFTTDRSKSFF